MREIIVNGITRDLSHLAPFEMKVEIDNKPVTLQFSFYNHCYTDEKGEIPMNFSHEERYWSEDRYRDSRNLRQILEQRFLQNYAVVYLNKKQAEQYHVMEIHDYAIFFDINKASDTENTLKIKIISAYTVDQWGKATIPRRNPKKVRWILSRRLQGQSAL